MASFGIRTPTDLLNKLIEDQRDFEESHCLSARHAINATMTAYHLHEWVWGAFVKARPDLHRTWRLSPGKKSNRKHFKKWLETQCPAFADVEKVADGTKHFDASAIPTGEHKAHFSAARFRQTPSTLDICGSSKMGGNGVWKNSSKNWSITGLRFSRNTAFPN